MSDIPQKAMALVKEVLTERGCDTSLFSINRRTYMGEALCRAIERHEAFRPDSH